MVYLYKYQFKRKYLHRLILLLILTLSHTSIVSNVLYITQASLVVLNISGNALDNLNYLLPLNQLTDLLAQNNKLSDLTMTTQVIGGLRSLRCLNLTGNPVCSCVKYRDRLILSAPRVGRC